MLNSTGSQDSQVLKLRAHHICCFRFITTELLAERSSDMHQVGNKIKNILLSQPESVVMVIEGADELCKVCPLCIDERCSSPLGDEDEIRKWDAILLKELGLSFGSCLTSGEWKALIEQKTPFKLCQKCQWKQSCSVGVLIN